MAYPSLEGRPIGHYNCAAIGVEGLPTTWRKGNSHDEIKYLQGNLNTFYNIPELRSSLGLTQVSVTGTFDTNTETNLKKIQGGFGLIADGIYGKMTRNVFHFNIGTSPVSFVRLGRSGTGWENYNDILTEYLDHSWFTSSTLSTIWSIGIAWNNLGKGYSPIQMNDGSLVKGEDTPDHKSHQNGEI